MERIRGGNQNTTPMTTGISQNTSLNAAPQNALQNERSAPPEGTTTVRPSDNNRARIIANTPAITERAQVEKQLKNFLLTGKADEMEKLLQDNPKFDLNARSLPGGATLLHFAVKLKDATPMVEILLRHGASVSTKDDKGQNVLDHFKKLKDQKSDIENLLNDAFTKESGRTGLAGNHERNSHQTNILRFPHLITWLSQPSRLPKNPDILLVGPGTIDAASIGDDTFKKLDGISPQLCEVMACLPKAKCEIIDNNPKVIDSISNAEIDSDNIKNLYLKQKDILPAGFDKKLTSALGNPASLKPTTSQCAAIEKADLPEKSKDLIIATYSLLYPARLNREANNFDKNHALFSRMLNAVKPGGYLLFEIGTFKTLFSGEISAAPAAMQKKSNEMVNLTLACWGEPLSIQQIMPDQKIPQTSEGRIVSISNGKSSYRVTTDGLIALQRPRD